MKRALSLFLLSLMVVFVTSCGTIAGTISGPLAGAPAVSEELHKSGAPELAKWLLTPPAWVVGAVVGVPLGFIEGIQQDADRIFNGVPYEPEPLLDTVDSNLE